MDERSGRPARGTDVGAYLNDPADFWKKLERGLRKACGRQASPLFKRWRNTRGGDEPAGSLSPQALRFLVRFGVLDASLEASDLAATYREVLRRVARATGEAPGVVAAAVQAYAAGEYGALPAGICDRTPQCTACPLCDDCRYLASGGRDERLDGQALEQALAAEGPGKGFAEEAAELLAVLISDGRGGAKTVARAQALLKARGGVRGVIASSPKDLRASGLGDKAVARLRAAARLFEEWSRELAPARQSFSCGEDFYNHFHLRLRDLKQEQFYVVGLDQKLKLIGEELVSSGSLTETVVNPREVLNPVIRWRAAAMAVVHNHPSGDPAPSPQDKALTKRLCSAAEVVGIRFVDHIVVGDGRYFSFVDGNLL